MIRFSQEHETKPVVEAERREETALHAGYRVVIEPSAARLRAVFAGETIADSVRALIMHETRLPQVFYFLREDVRMDLLERSPHHTHCPFKGNATYWSLKAGGREAKEAVWSYESPFDESSSIKDYMGFDWAAMDHWLADDAEFLEQPRDADVDGDNPFVDWVLNQAWQAKSSPDLVERLSKALVEAGFPLWRLRLFVRTLNPQLFGLTYTWQRDVEGVTESQATHAGIQSSQFLDSPLAPIFNGEGGIRRRLDGPNPRLDFPVLEDLVKEGATDYVAMPLRFSDGQNNILILVSDQPGGFTTGELGQLYEVLATLGRLLESHALRVSSLALLRAYLGRNAGERVMNGLVKRGDGENLHAVILLADLRDSTSLAAALSREDYLDAINCFFDCVAGAVIEHGGEVLKFIGDAVLAVFAIDDPDSAQPDCCRAALAAVRTAQARQAEANREHEKDSGWPLSFGVGLHRGSLTYGNVGSVRRLDFTVIGQAVNEVARIEDLCKVLGEPVLMSADFASSVPDRHRSRGRHTLRGVAGEQEIFAPE